MNEREVQKFLDSYTEKNKLHISTIDFNGQKAAYLIKKASEAYNINPKLLLSKLQVEQQLIKGDKAANPTKQQLNGAMGVGMLDDGTVIEGLQGFVNQINYAAKYFRQYFNEAEVVDFTHKNVDGKELKVVNAATYSLYRYTPHIAGPKLVYDVYKMFFSNEDLGGLLKKENNEGSISLKLLGGTALIIAVLLFFGTCFASNRAEAPIFSWKNEINLEDNNKIIADLEIFSEKKATEADAPYCGFRFGKIYESNARLFLSHDDKIIDSINLTNPELVLPDFSEEYFAYYKPWDIDGDGRKQEFVVQEYASCNGNSLSFIRLNQELDKFEKIPIVYDNNADGFNLFVDTGQDSLQVNNGNIIVTYYDVGNGKFIKDRYIFDRVKNKLVWTENSTVKGESLFYSNYYLKNISESIEMLVESANKSFYFTPEFYTVLATLFASIVALFTPFVMHWLSNKPKKSKLIAKNTIIVKQNNKNVGRIIIKNDDEKYKASSVEAYLVSVEIVASF
ncbi:MAG: hypothetical protein V1655_00490 [bacterium]